MSEENSTQIPKHLPDPEHRLAPLADRLVVKMYEFSAYPPDAILTSSGFMIDQSIHYRANDLEDEVASATLLLEGAPDFTSFLEQLIGRIKDAYPGDVSKWMSDFVRQGIDRQSTLQDVAEAGAANCFIRGVAFTGILQQMGIEAKVVEGDWVETSRNRVLGRYAAETSVEYRDASTSYGSGMRFLKGEKGEFHAFVLVKQGDKMYFADPALWVKDEEGTSLFPLVREVSEDEIRQKDIVFPLDADIKRHYVFKNGRGLDVEETQAA